MNNKLIAILAIAVVLIAGWLIYGHNASNVNMQDGLTLPSGTTATDTSTPAPTGTTTTDSGTKVDEFTVSGGNYFFAPKTLSVNKGDTVKITFINSGGFHDFVIDEYNVKTSTLQSGQSATVTFVADKTGNFQYYCSVGNHRAMGMWGTLTVN